MSVDINSVCLTGRLVKDIEVKEIGQSNLVSGTIASNKGEKKGEEWVETPNFIDFKTWVKSPKQLEFYKKIFTKGVKVVLNGELRMESWETDGHRNSKLLINVQKIDSMSSGKGNTTEQNKDEVTNYSQDSGFPEDIPF